MDAASSRNCAQYLVHATSNEHDLLPPVSELSIKIGQDRLSLPIICWPVLIVDGGPPVPFVSELEMLPSMGPIHGGLMVVRQPHKAFGSQDSLDWALALRWSQPSEG